MLLRLAARQRANCRVATASRRAQTRPVAWVYAVVDTYSRLTFELGFLVRISMATAQQLRRSVILTSPRLMLERVASSQCA